MYNVCIIPKLNAPQSNEVLHIIELIKQACSDIGSKCVVDIQGLHEFRIDERPLMFVAVGGDGTMLQAMKYCAEVLDAGDQCVAYGINLGQVGFLTDLAKGGTADATFRSTLSGLFSGENQTIEERIVLSMNFAELAVNDIAISQKFADEMINYHLIIDGKDAGTHKANSLVISTPTGSTAYSLSAGGALMTPTLKAIQLVPVASVRLTSRPIITSHDRKIAVEVWGDNITVRVDGQVRDSRERTYTKEDPYVIEVSGNQFSTKVVHFDGWNFFDVLSAKLGWVKS